MIYFDNSATTKPSDAVLAAMSEAARELWGNPSSVHAVGDAAQRMVRTARRAVLTALGAPANTAQDEQSLVFCGSGTEANNLAVFGTYYAKNHRTTPRIVTTDSEHPSVREPIARLAAQGAEVVYLSTRGGELDLEQLRAALTPNTVLLSMMHVNNETGAVYDVPTAFALAKQMCPNIVTHTDCVQAFGKIPLSVKTLHADLVTLSAHKIHGPKGVGALYVAPELFRAKKLVPYILGGGQEGGMRSGTENTVGIAGFGAAVTALHDMRAAKEVRQYLIDRLPTEIRPNLPKTAAPHILSITLPQIKSETMLHFLSARGICVSAGSACAAHGKGVNYVLSAFGLSQREADTTLRISLSHDATTEQADALLDALKQGLDTLIRIRR